MSEQRLAPLPKRVVDRTGAGAAIEEPPGEYARGLLERAEVLLATLDRDVGQLRIEQEEEILRIEAEHRRQVANVKVAEEVLDELLTESRDMAQRKGKADVLDRGLRSHLDPREVRSLEDVVVELRGELRVAAGITGAIRLEHIGRLLLEANLCTELMKLQAASTKQALIDETTRDLEKESTEAGASFDIGSSLLARDIERLEEGLPLPARRWGADSLEGWDPPEEAVPWLRVGGLTRDGLTLAGATIPALVDLPSWRGMVVDAGAHRDDAMEAVRSVMARILAAYPPGGVRLSLIDPSGMGTAFGSFLQLADHDPLLIDGGVATTEADVAGTLQRLADHVERVVRQYLQGRYATLAEANRSAGEVLEPHRVLVVADYPSAFTPEAQELLGRLVEQGPAAGLITLVVRQGAQRRQRTGAGRPKATKRTRPATAAALPGLDKVTADAQGLWYDTGATGRWRLAVDRLPPSAPGAPGPLDRLVAVVGEGARRGDQGGVGLATTWRLLAEACTAATRADLPASRSITAPGDPETWWSADVRRGVAVPIGRTGVRDVATLALDEGRGGALVVGRPGSGVTTLLATLVTGLGMLYDPRRLDLQLVSMDHRATFASAATAGLPHASLIADHAERELALSVLERLARKVEEAAPEGEDDERRATVLVVDGLESILGGGDALANEAALHLEQVLQLGPAVGVHVVAAVRASDARIDQVERTLDALPLDAVGSRLVLDCHEGLVDRLTGGQADAADEGLRPGEARLVSAGATTVVRPVRLTVTTDRDRYRLYRGLRDLADRRGMNRRPRIHDGSAAVRLELSPLHLLVVNAAQREARRTPRLWLGEPAGLGDPVEVLLRRQEGANLLLVTDRQELGVGMVVSALTSALLVHGAKMEARVLDYTPLDGGLTEAVRAFGDHWNVRLDRRRTTAKVLDRVHRTVQDRLASGTFDGPPVLLFLAGLDRARDLEPGRALPGEPELSEVLAAVLRDGPDVGVHVVAWSSGVEALDRRLGAAAQREFALRVATRLDTESSEALLDSSAASDLRDNQAVLHDEDWGRVVRFRPFVPPPVSWLRGLAAAAAGVSQGR